jgi:hypothetical protein
MSKSDMVRAYTESLLKQILGTDKIVRDDDGDYPVRHKSALYYVRVDPGSKDIPIVQVFAVALADVSPSAELYEEINQINSKLRFARAFWVRDQVLIESEMIGEELSLAGLETGCETVAGAADYFGPQLSEQFGGRTAFADEQGTDYEPPVEQPSPGMYL